MISLNSALLLPVVNFVNGFRFELMYISLIVSIRSCRNHLHGFQLLVLLSQFIETFFFVCTNRIDNLTQKESSGKLVIVAEGFFKLASLHMLIKQKSPSLPRNLAHRTIGELLIMFSTKVNLLYLLYSVAWRCCLLHLLKQNCFQKTFLKFIILMTQISLYTFSFLVLI